MTPDNPTASLAEAPSAGTVEIKGNDGTVIAVTLPEPSVVLMPSAYAFAIHKSGSVLLDHIIIDLCRAIGVEAFGFDTVCFARGLPIAKVVPQSARALLSRSGYFFYGFRGLHEFMRSMDLSQNKKIILVRDPRDILTSYFFSIARSHGVPQAGGTRELVLRQREAAQAMPIDEYVLSQHVNFIRRNFQLYMGLEGPSTKVFRYEDVIFAKRAWVAAINDWFGLGVPESAVVAIADRHDIIPSEENPDRHIRQVNPGNHLKHLKPETIAEINRRYADVMAHFGYA